MDKIEIEKIIACQRKYFATGATLPVNKRLDALRRLQAAMKKYSDRLDEALRADHESVELSGASYTRPAH